MTHNLDILLALIAGIVVGCTSIYIGDSLELFIIKTTCFFFLFYFIGRYFKKRFTLLLVKDEENVESEIFSTEDELILAEDQKMDQEQVKDDAGIEI